MPIFRQADLIPASLTVAGQAARVGRTRARAAHCRHCRRHVCRARSGRFDRKRWKRFGSDTSFLKLESRKDARRATLNRMVYDVMVEGKPYRLELEKRTPDGSAVLMAKRFAWTRCCRAGMCCR